MAVSQPLSANENFSRPSLRSLAPLLNDLPPPSFSPHIPSPRPTATEHSCQNKNLKPHPNSASFQSPASPPTIESTPCPRPILKSSSLDSSSGASESPPTPSSQQFHSISPFSYAAFHPECTSVSSPILATSLDHPDYHAAPPSKRPRQLLNPEVRTPFLHHPHHHADAQNHSTYSARITGNFPKNHIPTNDPVPVPTIHPKLKPLSGSCSASSREADDSTYLPQYSDDHPPESHTYSHLGALAHPILLDEDRSLCTRPLKNTKRAAQNRAAQRAFRERKDRYVRELEARSVQFEEYLARYGLLEERERQIAAREAEFMHTSRQSRTINDGGSMDLKPMSSDEEKLNHIEKLEHQLNTSRQEIARLRVELLKFHNQEEMDQSCNRHMDWERGDGEISLPRAEYDASDVDIGAQTHCSPISSSSRITTRKPTASHHSQLWSRENHNGGKNYAKTEPTGKDHMCLDQRTHGNSDLTMPTATESQRESISGPRYSRNGCSGGDSTDASLGSHRQGHFSLSDITSDPFEQGGRDRKPIFASQCASEHPNGISALLHLSVPLRKATTENGFDRPVRLPAIQMHPEHSWSDDNRARLSVMK